MANEQNRNVLFVQQIGQHSCLYDNTYPNYAITDKKEMAWEDTAEQTSKN